MTPSKNPQGYSKPKGQKNSSTNRQREDKQSGGAPRKYTKSKAGHQEKNKLDPIPGNQEWGGLARKGVLRVHHDVG